MKNLILTLTLLTALIFTSCYTTLETGKIINQKSPFSLTVKTIDKETGLSENQTVEIAVDSYKWKNLLDFAAQNVDGWKSAPASYIGDIYVKQGDFRLIHTMNSKSVVIAFVDKEGKTKQYSKGIKEGELSFLYEK